MKNPFPKRPCVGQRGMPREWVDTMYREYLRAGSVEKVGKRFGRTRQGVWELFRARGLKLNEKKLLPKREFKGMTFTLSQGPGRARYYRSTTRHPEVLLHRAIWEDANGPIPEGWVLRFKDGNSSHCELDNLELMTRAEQQDAARDGSNQFTRTAAKRLDLLLRSAQGETPVAIAKAARLRAERRAAL